MEELSGGVEERGAVGTPKKTAWAWAVATTFGIGYLKPGPGTFGAVAAAAVWLGVFHAFPVSMLERVLLTLAATAAVSVIGTRASTLVARESGRKDPGFVVIDEVVGQWVALTVAVPSLPYVLLALVLFRIFDIAKPWPIRRFEALPEGTGIIADDLVAGAVALMCYALLLVPFGHMLLR